MSTAKAKTYIEAIGRRKTATARVRMEKASKTEITVNDKPLRSYFQEPRLSATVEEAFTKGKIDGKYTISVRVIGGGISSQAEAVRHGISRALVEEDAEARPKLKKVGLLKRDARAKERRKFGLKKARKRAQWSKR